MTLTQKHNAPALRFPEFSGDWENSMLSKHVVALDAGVSVNSGDRPAGEGELGILKTSAVTKGVFESYESKVVFESREIKRIKEPVQADTIIISRMNTPALVGANAYIAEDYKNLFLPDRLWAAKPAPESSSKFISYILGSAKGRAALSRRATGTSGSMKNITKPDVLALRISAPALLEQQKIAAFLSSVDRKLAQLGQKKALLQRYKKGMMQKLFSQELRFKDAQGHDFPDWDEKRLGEVLKESRIKGSTGETAKKITVKLWGRGVFYKDTKGSPNTQYYKRKRGQFIYSKLDFLNCAFGVIPMELDGFESTVDLPCFDVLNGNSAMFLLDRISQKNFYKRLGDIADGSRKAKRIHANTFLDFNLLLPSPREQQKIADFLSSIDRKIDLVATELDHAKTFKKGLLQQMFI